MARTKLTLQERGLASPARRIVVACSGGPDSQVLLHALHALRADHGCELLAASVNHGLRQDAANDVAAAAALAELLKVPFAALAVQVQPGASRQAQARAARYEALLLHARQCGAECVAVGHTLDDQAETVLARLLRGASLEGLAGISPRRADGVIRPLIDVPRAWVRGYALELGLQFVQDPSNDDPRYLRSRVRHELLPALAKENPHLQASLAALADDAREVGALLGVRADQLAAQARQHVCALQAVPRGERLRAIKHIVESEVGAQLHRQHLVAIDRMLSTGGEVRLPGDVLARLEGNRLVFAPVTKRGRGVRRPTE